MGIRLWRFMCRVGPLVGSRQGTVWGSYGWIFTAFSAGHLYACIFKGVKLAKNLVSKACDMFLLNTSNALSSWSDSAAPPGMEVVAHRNRGLTAAWGVAATRHRAAPAPPADVASGPRTTNGQPARWPKNKSRDCMCIWGFFVEIVQLSGFCCVWWVWN
jgi:hypothetical protein